MLEFSPSNLVSVSNWENNLKKSTEYHQFIAYKMEDKVILVTGSSSGIGEASVIDFSKLGCKVVIHGTNMDKINAVSKRCKEVSPKNYDPLTCQADLSDEKQVRELFKKTIDHYGQLDVLVNNAGMIRPCSVEDENAYEIYCKTMSVNLNQVVLLTHLAAPYLKQTKGCIINVASNLHKRVLRNSWHYSTSKAAMVMFTECMAVELAPDVRVNSISPGPVATTIVEKTGMTVQQFRDIGAGFCPVGRIGEPHEISRLILFLASPESGFMTGGDYPIDGGGSVKPNAELAGHH